MVPGKPLVEFRSAQTVTFMAEGSSTPADSLLCSSCGHSQDRSELHCRQCGAPLAPPGLIYRRQSDGRWTIVRDIDLSSLAPRPARAPRKWLTRRGGLAIAALVVVMALLLFIASWKHEQSRQAVMREVAQYLHYPVGRIVPGFQLEVAKISEGSLRLTGRCNLPSQTQLEIRILAEDRVVALDYPVVVSEGSFTTRSLLDRGRPFVAGIYRAQVKADFGERWQPPPVLLVVGNLGQRLEGPLVQRRGVSSEAEVIYTEEFKLE